MSLSEKLKKELKEQLPQCRILDDNAARIAYAYDNSKIHKQPDLVILPRQESEVLTVLKFCNKHLIPVTARGRGTGTTGASVPIKQGIVLSFEQMNRIIETNGNDRYMIVEPGVTNQEIQQNAQKQGFFWAPDPTSAAFCTVGGNLAYNSAGPRAVKYGTPRDNTLGLHAITGNAEKIITGVYTTKGVVGYDLTRLIIGSEGTLAIITRATLKLTPLAPCKISYLAYYPTIETASEAVASIMAQPITPCTLEFIDGQALNLIRDAQPQLDIPKNAQALLMIEIDGQKMGLQEAAEKVIHLANNHESTTIMQAFNSSEMWRVRKALSPILRNFAPNKINEDVVVPVSKLPELISGLQHISKQFAIPIVNFGHAGNGNIHTNLLYDKNNLSHEKNKMPCLNAVFELVLKLNGTLSGEHGIGLVKRKYIDKEITQSTLKVMTRIKQQFDFNHILNPEKIFPTT